MSAILLDQKFSENHVDIMVFEPYFLFKVYVLKLENKHRWSSELITWLTDAYWVKMFKKGAYFCLRVGEKTSFSSLHSLYFLDKQISEETNMWRNVDFGFFNTRRTKKRNA